MSVNVRRSSAAHPKDYDHPYLSPAHPLPKKREFGLCNLFLFKVCGCFNVGDDLPPPNYETPVYQAGAKSSSSVCTFNTTTTTTRTASRTNSPAKDSPQSPTVSTSTTTTTTNFQATPSTRDLVGSTGVENIPYRRPPPEAPNPKPKLETRTVPKSSMGSNRASEDTELRERKRWQSRVPDTLAEVDEAEPAEPRKIVGNVSRLSSMFEN